MIHIDLNKTTTKGSKFLYSVQVPTPDGKAWVTLKTFKQKTYNAVLIVKLPSGKYTFKHWFEKVNKIGKHQSKQTMKTAYALAFVYGQNPTQTPQVRNTGFIKRLGGDMSVLAGLVGKITRTVGDHIIIEFKHHRELALPIRGEGLSWEYTSETEYNKFTKANYEEAIKGIEIHKPSPAYRVAINKLADDISKKGKIKKIALEGIKLLKHEISLLDDTKLEQIANKLKIDISKYSKMTNVGLRRMNTINVLANATTKQNINLKTILKKKEKKK